MEEKITADNAENGFPDISGVKQTEELAAEAPKSYEVPADKLSETELASSVKEGESGDGAREDRGLPGDNSTLSEADEEDLDAEFEALIKGRYRQAYKKRMENTVRRRLKNGRARSVSVPITPNGEKNSVFCEKTESAPETEIAAPIGQSADARFALLEAQRTKNRSRPTENGVGGSVGVVTRINVSALSGSDILGIIHRATTGEKITFS